MNNLIINNNSISIKEFNGQRVITFKDIDKVHNRPEGTAKRNFNDNKSKFIEGEDFFLAKPQNIQKYEKRTFTIPPRGIIVLTETGYLMLAKSLTDDLAWKVQRELVTTYFNVRTQSQDKTKLPEQIYEYKQKFHNGVIVITLKDIEHFTGISRGMASYYLRRYNSQFVIGVDYWCLGGNELAKFKSRNKCVSKLAGNLTIVSESGFKKLAKITNGIPKEMKCFSEPKQMIVLKAYTKVVVDIPENEKYQKEIKGIKDKLITVETLLNYLSRYLSKGDADAHMQILKKLGVDLCVQMGSLSKVEYSLVEKAL